MRGKLSSPLTLSLLWLGILIVIPLTIWIECLLMVMVFIDP
jgi:hypothetical protein